jgi:hypothetical protein
MPETATVVSACTIRAVIKPISTAAASGSTRRRGAIRDTDRIGLMLRLFMLIVSAIATVG